MAEFGCDQCAALMINGVFCHETGCVNQRKTWVAERGAWVRFVACHECGCDVEVGESCDCQEFDEEEVCAPDAPPGPRWTGDRGAIPGEAAYLLDDDGTWESNIALIERETPEGSRWEAMDDQQSIGEFSTLAEAAQAAEVYVDEKDKQNGQV